MWKIKSNCLVLCDSPMLHVVPSHPGEHLHWNVSPSSWQVPPLLHVASSHWLSPVGSINIFRLLELYTRMILNKCSIGCLEHCVITYCHKHIPWTCTGRQHGCGNNKKRALTGVARLSLPAILALAKEISHQVSTCPSIMTGAGAAVIDV